MMIMRKIAGWLNNLFVTPEEHYLSGSVDLADFERRQRIVEKSKHASSLYPVWY